MWRQLALITLCAGSLQAQSVYFGVRAGQSSARQVLRAPPPPIAIEDVFLDVIELPAAEKTGSVAPAAMSGVSVTIELNKFIALESDLLFTEKGMRDGLGNDLRADYLEMPLLLRLGWPLTDEGGVQLFAHGGPAPAEEIACRSRAFDGQVFRPIDCGTWRGTKLDFGLAYGGGLLIRKPQYQLTLSWRRTEGKRDLERENVFVARLNETNAFLIGFVVRMK